jgi:hypothetical protein
LLLRSFDHFVRTRTLSYPFLLRPAQNQGLQPFAELAASCPATTSRASAKLDRRRAKIRRKLITSRSFSAGQNGIDDSIEVNRIQEEEAKLKNVSAAKRISARILS